MNDEIVNKIKKLLRLGESPNENEAQTAVALAQKLMDKYNIHDVMLNANKEEQEDIKDQGNLWKGNKSRSQWRIALASAVANANSCRIYLHGPDIRIVGRTSDVATVNYLFNFCESEIERFAACYKNGKSWANNYKLGFVAAIKDKLKEAKKEAREELMLEHGSAAGAAIVFVDQRSTQVEVWMNQKMNLKPGKGFGNQNLDQSARAIGYRDGKRLDLSRGGPKLKA